jgi:hypothetical protein
VIWKTLGDELKAWKTASMSNAVALYHPHIALHGEPFKTVLVSDCIFYMQDLMLLLEAVEEHLGPIDSWPTYIIRYMFTDHPTPVKSANLKKVIAFFFGNGVPCALACQLYHACNGK